MIGFRTIEDPAKVIEEGLEKIILTFPEIEQKIEKMKNFDGYKMECEISINILNKLDVLTKNMLNVGKDNLLSNCSSVRYALETLIVTKKMLIEPKQKYCLYYSLGI